MLGEYPSLTGVTLFEVKFVTGQDEPKSELHGEGDAVGYGHGKSTEDGDELRSHQSV